MASILLDRRPYTFEFDALLLHPAKAATSRWAIVLSVLAFAFGLPHKCGTATDCMHLFSLLRH